MTYNIKSIEIDTNKILIIQLPRTTNQLSKPYIDGVTESLYGILPEGTKVGIIGNDVNIYEIASEDAVVLKLKGIF